MAKRNKLQTLRAGKTIYNLPKADGCPLRLCGEYIDKMGSAILATNLVTSFSFKFPSQKISGGIHRNRLEPVINRKVLMGNSEPFFQISFL